MTTQNHRVPNKKARNNRSAKQRDAFYQSSGCGENIGLKTDFVATTNTTKRIAVVEELSKQRSVRNSSVVGAMCIELAHNDRRNSSAWLERAGDTLQSSIASFSINGLVLAAPRAHAERLLASMPHYYSVLVEGRLPNLDWNRTMYSSIAKIAQRTAVDYDLAITGKSTNQALGAVVGEIKGESSEQAAHLLSLRAADMRIGSELWSPAPSYFSQDHASLQSHSYENPSWDLTVQTRRSVEAPIEDTFLVQVKSRHAEPEHNRREYTSDITVLNIAEDLRLEHERTMVHPMQIIREVVAEQAEHTGRPMSNLDGRVDLLLDILG